MQRFEIRDRLGSGGFGTVYRAWDRRLERYVAVKVVETGPRTGTAHQARGPGSRAAEPSRASSRCSSSPCTSSGPKAAARFWSASWSKARPVRALIDGDLLSDREVAEIGADICEALDHAHARGVVHRDIKPANLIYPYRSGGAKLMDFGIARLTDAEDLTNTGDVLGTLSYMAPEQADGLPVGPAGDVFSLALTLYEAWTGENPRRRATPSATARRARRRGAPAEPMPARTFPRDSAIRSMPALNSILT